MQKRFKYYLTAILLLLASANIYCQDNSTVDPDDFIMNGLYDNSCKIQLKLNDNGYYRLTKACDNYIDGSVGYPASPEDSDFGGQTARSAMWNINTINLKTNFHLRCKMYFGGGWLPPNQEHINDGRITAERAWNEAWRYDGGDGMVFVLRRSIPAEEDRNLGNPGGGLAYKDGGIFKMSRTIKTRNHMG
jgi:Bacterial lectin